jgi:mono/diheme cytochrome c family protein
MPSDTSAKRSGPARRVVAASIAVLLPMAVGASPGTTDVLKPPIDLADPANIEAGRQMFNVTCTHYCHGKDARGSGLRGPSLRNGGFDNWYLYGRISGGRPPMPAFAGIYTSEQIWKIIAYIQSLRD